MREEKKSVTDYLQLYVSKWKYFVVSVVVCLTLGALWAYMKSPVYEVDANVLITDNDKQSDFLRSFSMADMFGASANADEELLLISSYSLFNDVVRKYDINETYIIKKNFLKRIRVYDETPIKIECDSAIPDTLSVQLIFKLKINDEGLATITGKSKDGKFIKVENKHLPLTLSTIYGKFRFATTKYYEPGEPLNIAILFGSYASATESLQELVECYIPSRKANVITVSMKCTDIPFAEKVVNTILEEYNLRGIEDTRTRNQVTAGFIDARLNAITDDLNSTEVAVENYKNENNLIDLAADAQYIFTKKGTIDEALVTAETEYEILEMTRELMNDPEHKYDLIPTPYGAEAAVDAIAEYNKLILERMKLVNNAKTNNNAALRTISGQLDAMRDNINATLDRSLASARVKLHDLREQMNESDSRLGQLPRQEREFLNIKRQQMVKENLYLFLLKQREETSLRIANAIPKGTVIDKAYAMTKPISMTPKMTLFIAFIFGLVLPPVYFYIKALLRNKITSRRELEQLSGLPVLGEVSANPENYTIFTDKDSTIGRQMNRLCSNLQFVTHNDDQVISVTSLNDGEGKTFVSANLAAAFARGRKKVVLIDLDMRKEGLSDILSAHAHSGSAHYLSGKETEIDNLIIHTDKSLGFDAIVAGAMPPNREELLSSERVDTLFSELRKIYDYIIIDSFPVNGDNDGFILSKVSDVTVFVCRAHHTMIKEIKNIDAICASHKLKRAALVINGVRH